MPRVRTPPRVVGYIRVSTEDQAGSGLGLEGQRAAIELYAELYDFEVAHLVEDAGVSGKSIERPGLQCALDGLKSADIDGLIVAKLDRLTRSVRDLELLIDRYFKEGGALLLRVGEQVDSHSPEGRLVVNVPGSVSQWEREAIAERTKAA